MDDAIIMPYAFSRAFSNVTPLPRARRAILLMIMRRDGDDAFSARARRALPLLMPYAADTPMSWTIFIIIIIYFYFNPLLILPFSLSPAIFISIIIYQELSWNYRFQLPIIIIDSTGITNYLFISIERRVREAALLQWGWIHYDNDDGWLWWWSCWWASLMMMMMIDAASAAIIFADDFHFIFIWCLIII